MHISSKQIQDSIAWGILFVAVVVIFTYSGRESAPLDLQPTSSVVDTLDLQPTSSVVDSSSSSHTGNIGNAMNKPKLMPEPMNEPMPESMNETLAAHADEVLPLVHTPPKHRVERSSVVATSLVSTKRITSPVKEVVKQVAITSPVKEVAKQVSGKMADQLYEVVSGKTWSMAQEAGRSRSTSKNVESASKPKTDQLDPVSMIDQLLEVVIQ